MTDTLTDRQRDIYDFIERRIADGRSPTYREIAAHFGIASPNGVACHLRSLARKGLLVMPKGKFRCIELTDPLAVLLRQINRLDKEQLAELKRRLP